MRAGLQRALAALRGVLAHELKDPLNAVLLDLELQRETGGAAEGGVESAIAALRRLDQAASDLVRLLGSADEGEEEPIDLAAILADCTRRMERAAARRGLRLGLEPPDEPTEGLARLDANPGRVRILLWNLLLDALDAAAPASRLTVRLLPEPSRARLQVAFEPAPGTTGELPSSLTRSLARSILSSHTAELGGSGGRLELVLTTTPAGAPWSTPS